MAQMKRKKWGLAGLGLILGVTACTSSGHKASAGASSTSTSVSASSSPSASSSSAVSSSSSSSTSAAAVSSTSSTAAGPVRCPTGSLTGTLTNENGTAGSVYYTLLLTNRGSSSCVMQGWPGVSFVSSAAGSQVGAAATRIAGPAPSVTLAPGASAGAALQITEATNYGSGCQVTPVGGLRVYPPNQTASLYVAHNDNACANPTDVTLHVGAFQAST